MAATARAFDTVSKAGDARAAPQKSVDRRSPATELEDAAMACNERDSSDPSLPYSGATIRLAVCERTPQRPTAGQASQQQHQQHTERCLSFHPLEDLPRRPLLHKPGGSGQARTLLA